MGVAATVGVAGFCAFRILSNEEAEISYKETQVKRGNITIGVTESGSVTIGTVEQDLEDLEDLEGLESAAGGGQGQNPGSAGDAILKLSAESVAEYKEAPKQKRNSESKSK